MIAILIIEVNQYSCNKYLVVTAHKLYTTWYTSL